MEWHMNHALGQITGFASAEQSQQSSIRLTS